MYARMYVCSMDDRCINVDDRWIIDGCICVCIYVCMYMCDVMSDV